LRRWESSRHLFIPFFLIVDKIAKKVYNQMLRAVEKWLITALFPSERGKCSLKDLSGAVHNV
jgi:hypothetical protein